MNNLEFRAWDKRINTMYPFVILGWNWSIEARLDIKDPESVRDIRMYNKNGNYEDYDGEIILMQWTGLYDKNGKKIYVGDIIQEGDLIYTIEFLDGCFIARLDDNIFLPLSEVAEFSEIIGDIYNNPKLLNTNK